MPTHPWFDLVIGGVSTPRILSVGDNLCSNPRFNIDTSGWTWGAGTSATHRAINDNAYSEYMGHILVTGGAGFNDTTVRYSVDYGSDIQGKKFLVAFRMMNDNSSDYAFTISAICGQDFNDDVEYQELFVTQLFANRYAFVTDAIVNSSNYFTFAISGGLGKNVRFDDVYICEVLDDFTFAQPQSTNLMFNKFLEGSLTLFDGKNKEFNKKWIPNYHASFLYSDVNNETYRQRIAEADSLFVMPHDDFEWGFFALWDEDFKRSYSFERFFGHAGDIVLKGNEHFVGTLHPISSKYSA